VRAVGGYHFTTGTLHTKLGDASGDVDAILARTGYTGEDGFELYVKNADAPAVWNAVVAHGATPAGLACRDTLRLEAGMALYGNDIDDAHTPLEASLGWIVKLDKREKRGVDFIGANALRAQKAAGVPRLLRGLEMSERGIPRHGYPILDDSGGRIGEVTSGTQPPFLGRPIAMAYVDRAHSEPGSVVSVEIRGKPVKATVVKLPFYKRAK
jgi:aminomethyltransferase